VLTFDIQKDYEEDFLRNKQSHYEYIQKLQQWRDKYETFLDSRPRIQVLDHISHYLTEFQYGKFDEIEVPGQYTEVRYQLSILIQFLFNLHLFRTRTITITL
jgi:transformation/transcription domain-associated protein